MGRGTMRSMVEGARRYPLAVARDPSTTPLRVAVPLPVPGRILSGSISHLPHHISRGQIAAGDIIVAAVAGFGAADLAGVPPDDLGIMADVAEFAGGARLGDRQRPVIAPLGDPMADHLAIGVGAAGARPQILALRR